MKKFLKEYFLWVRTSIRKLIWTYAVFNLFVAAPTSFGIVYYISKFTSFHQENKLQRCESFTFRLMEDNVNLSDISESWEREKEVSDRNFQLCNERLDEMLGDPSYNKLKGE